MIATLRRGLFALAVLLYAHSAAFAQAPMLALPDFPEDPATFDWNRLEPIKLDRIFVFRGVSGESAFTLHSYLAQFDNKLWAMWSCGAVNEDDTGQHIRYSTSEDGLVWSDAAILVPPDADPAMRYIARGLWVRDGKLLALVSRDEVGGYFGPSLELRAYPWDAATSTWGPHAVVRDDTINNFPPKQLPTGEWMMSRRNGTRETSMIIGGVTAIDDWAVVDIPFPPDAKLEEPYWWLLPDNRLSALFRDNAKSRRLYRAFSSDNGRTWTAPERTNFPDATSKFNALKLADGRYVLVSNPNPNGRIPLCLSISDDGLTFTRMGTLLSDTTAPRSQGRAKSPGYQYPHVIQKDDYLYITCAQNKEDILVLRIELSDLAEL